MIQNFFIVRQNWNIGLFVFIQRKASVLGKVSGKLNLPRPIKGPVWQRNVCAGRENPGYSIVTNKSYCQWFKIYDDKKNIFQIGASTVRRVVKKTRIFYGQAGRKRWPPTPLQSNFRDFIVLFWPYIMIICVLKRILHNKKAIFHPTTKGTINCQGQ